MLRLAGVIWRLCDGVSFPYLRRTSLTHDSLVIEECGAMPDLEDKEGEVRIPTNTSTRTSTDILSTDCSSQSRLERTYLDRPVSITRHGGRSGAGWRWLDRTA